MSTPGVSTGCCVHALASVFGLIVLLAALATAFTAALFIDLGARLAMTQR